MATPAFNSSTEAAIDTTCRFLEAAKFEVQPQAFDDAVVVVPRVDRFMNKFFAIEFYLRRILTDYLLTAQPTSQCYHANEPLVFFFVFGLVLYLVLFISLYNFLLSLKHVRKKEATASEICREMVI